MVEVTLVPGNKKVVVKGGRSAGALLKELGLSSRSHLVLKGGQLLTEDERVEEGDEITIVSAISGGRG